MKLMYKTMERCLVCYRHDVSDSFWDNHWRDMDISSLYKSLSKYNLITRITRKYLRPQDGPILEGGCGVGQFVYSLSQAGYECIGVDTAKSTIAKVKNLCPTLILMVMDVRKLDFPDNYFAGYWSLGIIEHFFEGYDKILSEAKRVLKPGGYLFITFPYMSILRTLKAKLGYYQTIKNDTTNGIAFYQFVFDYKKVLKDLEKLGFKLTNKKAISGVKGFKDEVTFFKSILQMLYNYKGKSIFVRGLRFFLDRILSCFGAGHMILLILKLEKLL